MPRKIPAVLPPFTAPHGADDIVLTGRLAEGITLRLRANLETVKFKVGGASHCQDVGTPFDCIVSPGPHLVELFVPGPAARIVRTVTAKQKDIEVRFELGFVDAGAGKQIQVGGAAARRAAFEAGTRRVTVTGGEDGQRQVTVVVKPGATTSAN
jgi:hypothetical protein